MISDLASFVEGAAKAVQEAVLSKLEKNEDEEKQEEPKKEVKPKGKKKKKGEEEEREVFVDQLHAVRNYFERAAVAQDDANGEGGEQHKMYATLMPLNAGIREEEIVHTGPILHQGMLAKQGRRVNVWRDRFLILRETGIAYYSHQVEEKELEPITKLKADEGLSEEATAAVPQARTNLFFADIITVTGRVVDDLPMVQNPWLGGREHAFCLHTGASMFVFSAGSEDDKKNWIAAIEKAFSEFLNKQVRKVAMMELSWEVAGELGTLSTKPTNKTLAQKNLKGKTRILNATLERTQSRFMKKDVEKLNLEKLAIKREDTKLDSKKNKVMEAAEIKRRVAVANAQARVSINRINKSDHRRISKRSVNGMLTELTGGLENLFEQQVIRLRNKYILKKTFLAWLAYHKYERNMKRKKKGTNTLNRVEAEIAQSKGLTRKGTKQRSGFFTRGRTAKKPEF